MLRGEGARFALDAEQPGDEVLEMGRERDQKVGFGFFFRRIYSRGNEPVVQRLVGPFEEAEKRPVDAKQAFALVQIRETDAEAEGHGGKIIVEIAYIAQRITLFPSGVFNEDQ